MRLPFSLARTRRGVLLSLLISFLISTPFSFISGVPPTLLRLMPDFTTDIALWCVFPEPTAILGDVIAALADAARLLSLFGAWRRHSVSGSV